MAILSRPSPAVAQPRQPTPARLLAPQARQQLARDALDQPNTRLANQHQVSLTIVYRRPTRPDAIDRASTQPTPTPPNSRLPVSKPWSDDSSLVSPHPAIAPSRRPRPAPAISDHPLSLATIQTYYAKPSEGAASTTNRIWLRSISAPTTRFSRPANPCWSAPMWPRPTATFSRRGASRCRHLGRATAGIERTRLPSRRDHRRFRRGITGRPSGGFTRRALPGRRFPRLAHGDTAAALPG